MLLGGRFKAEKYCCEKSWPADLKVPRYQVRQPVGRVEALLPLTLLCVFYVSNNVQTSHSESVAVQVKHVNRMFNQFTG